MEAEKWLIDAHELVRKINKLDVFYFTGETDVQIHDCQMVELGAVLTEIDCVPTVDAVEVVHGRWVDRYSGKYANPLYECSECKNRAPYKFEDDSLHIGLWLQDLTDYCPNCGAKMDGGA